MRIWLDDIRDPPDDGWKICRTAEECIGTIWLAKEPIECISFDHDLGENCGTGYDVAKFLEHMAAMQKDQMEYFPQKWQIHSANPVGARNIKSAMESMKRFLSL